MKKVLFYVLTLSMIAASSCGDSDNGNIQGVFIKFSESPYSRAWDTIDVRVADTRRQTYLMDRKTGFQRFHADTLQPKQWKTRQSIMQYDASQRRLKDLHHEHSYFLNAGGDTLFNRHSAYHKIR